MSTKKALVVDDDVGSLGFNDGVEFNSALSDAYK
jgi:hypothetical protein